MQLYLLKKDHDSDYQVTEESLLEIYLLDCMPAIYYFLPLIFILRHAEHKSMHYIHQKGENIYEVEVFYR